MSVVVAESAMRITRAVATAVHVGRWVGKVERVKDFWYGDTVWMEVIASS